MGVASGFGLRSVGVCEARTRSSDRILPSVKQLFYLY